jgi:maleylacetoacetate isomerase
MQLYDYYRSSCAYRVRIALNVKQLDYTAIKIDLTQDQQHSEAYLKHNPQALVPTLFDDGHNYTQSLAIIEYLEEQYPSPPLLPGSSQERAQIRALALTIACDIHPLNNLRVLTALRKDWHAQPEQITRWYHHWLDLGLTAIEKQLAKQSRQQLFCYGDQITLADVCLIPQIYNAKRFELSLEPYPIICSIYEHCTQLPVFKNASPEVVDSK